MNLSSSCGAFSFIPYFSFNILVVSSLDNKQDSESNSELDEPKRISSSIFSEFSSLSSK